MRKIYGFLAVFLIAAGGTAWAVDITADVLTYDGKAKTVTATGNVVIHANEGAVVTGKKGQYYFENRSAWLDGGVEYQKDQTVMTAEKMYLYEDKTTRGVGGVYIHDEAEKRTMKGDDIMYNPETGFGKIQGNGYLESVDGIIEAPLIEGNMKQVKIEATGGVHLSSTMHQMNGYGDKAVYTRSGQEGIDGKLILTGNAHVVQNGNSFDGPELIMRDAEKIVETSGRSTITITNTAGASSMDAGNQAAETGSTERVTEETPIAGRPSYADEPAQSSFFDKDHK